MIENQSLWGKVVFIEEFSEEAIDSAKTTRERECIKEIIDRAGSKFSPKPFDHRPVTDIKGVREVVRDAEKVQNTIVHFSGHGGLPTPGGIIIPQYDLKGGEFLTPKELSPFFEGVKNIKCVVFNFCDSSEFAEETAKYVECAVGIAGDIMSNAAIGFAEGFYEHLRDTKPNQSDVFYEAFRKGKNASVSDDRGKFRIYFPESASKLDVKITKPEERSIVPRECECSGTFRKLPEGSSMWLYVNATIQRKFYLFPINDFSVEEGTWRKAGKEFTVGTDRNDEHNDYRIGVIVVDEKVTSDLDKDFSEGYEVCLDNLPSGEVFGDRVVYRRPGI